MRKSPLLFIILAVTAHTCIYAQKNNRFTDTAKDQKTKPYALHVMKEKININGKKIIASYMVWNLEGHRVAEQKNINSSFVSIPIQTRAKFLFLMITFADREYFTEKIALP